MTTKKDLEAKISKGRTFIILRDPFFATILMDMNPVIDGSRTDTCATDGETIMFNPEWLADADHKLVAAALRKMAIHVALSHHLRRGPHRQPARWRAACDAAALLIMQGEGVELPQGACPSPLFAGMTADQIYKHLEESDKDDQPDHDPDAAQGDSPAQGGGQPDGSDSGQGDAQGQGQGQGQSDKAGADGGVGQTLDGANMQDPTDVSQKQAENDQRNMRAQMAAKAQGKESGLGKELIDAIKAKGVDWRDRLQAFIDARAETRTSWSKPNRRFIGQDIYLPGKIANGIDTLAFIVDTSGSMSAPELAMCSAQIEAAREAIGIKKIVVIQIDTKVKAVTEFDQAEPLPTTMEFKGRGGTNMAPAFEEAARHNPSAAIMLTDGVFSDLTDAPAYPVLFALTHAGQQGRAPATFGQFVDLPDPAA